MGRGLDRLLSAAAQQRVRQLRRVAQLARAADARAALERASEERAEQERLRAAAREAHARKARADRVLQEALVEVRSLPPSWRAPMRARTVRRVFETMSGSSVESPGVQSG